MKQKLLAFLLMGIMAVTTAFAQNRTITGRVVGADDGLPLPGVSVRVKGSSQGTTTGSEGTFTINVPEGAKTLTFTYIGYATKEATLGNSNSINVRLESDAKQLSEVVVTGYTNTSRANSVSATSKVSSKEVNNVAVASLDQILQGRAAGLTVQAGSGQPGSAARVIIRGQGSINGSSTPLYILDGVPIESSVFSTLNPNDFESVNVLKDAAATSLYGSRGSNGVILITSKRGRAGKTVFTYSGQGGVSVRTSSKFEMLTTPELLKLQENGKSGMGWTLSPLNAATNTSLGAGNKQRMLDSISKINNDWTDYLFQNGSFQSHQVGASGGNEKTKFYSSISYYNQEGIALRSGLERYNLRLNLDHNADKFVFGIQTAAGWSQSDFIESEGAVALANPYAAAFLALPWESPYDSQGNIITSGTRNNYPFAILDSRIGSNSLDRPFSTTNKNNQFKGTVALDASYELVKGLKAKSKMGIDFRETDGERSIYPGTYPGGLTNPGQQGSFSQANTRNLQLINTSGFNYFNVIGSKHEIDASALVEVLKENYKTFNYVGYGINAKLKDTPAGVTGGTTTNGLIPSVGGSKTSAGFVSLIGIARYTYDDKYTLQASFRRDGSSRLPEANRFQNFYSVGANWDAKKERFFEDVQFINDLRIRASYGTTANGNGTSDFGYLPTFGSVSYAGTAGVAPSSPGNPNYDWEYSKNANIGFDLGILNNRINIQADVYNRITDNLFISQQLSRTAGFSSLSVNAGKVRNRGIETLVDLDILKKNDLDFSININFGYNENEVTDLGQVNEYELGTSIIRKGLPLGSHYMVRYGGADPQTGNPIYYNRDGSTTNVYNAATQSVAEFGSSNAPFNGGFGSYLRYKGVDLSTFFSFMSGYSRFNNETYFLTNVGFAGSYNQTRTMLDVWTTPGQQTQIQRFGSQRQFTSYDIQDASFLRLRNVILGYNLPSSLVKRLGFLSGARLYAQGQNLLTWTKWQGFDPEDNNNIAQFEYPAARTFTFGLDVRF
ncbi:MAG TPA: TonB-dependent receptor [Daejeonella sp.]